MTTEPTDPRVEGEQPEAGPGNSPPECWTEALSDDDLTDARARLSEHRERRQAEADSS